MKRIPVFLALGLLLGACNTPQRSVNSNNSTINLASDVIREVKISDQMKAQGSDLGDLINFVPMGPIKFNLEYVLDLRTTPLSTLPPKQLDRLSTADGVKIIMNDGSEFLYVNSDGVALHQGDIAVAPSKEIVDYILKLDDLRSNNNNLSQQNLEQQGLTQQGMLATNIWPNNTIPYFWRSGEFGSSHEATIKRSVQMWNNTAGGAVQWKWTPNARPGVKFISSTRACGWSYVGTLRRTQELGLNPRCNSTHTVIHEMGHSAGFWHEHQRCDRDKYVRVSSNEPVNFGKNCRLQRTTFGNYDYDSINNYSAPYVRAISTSAPYQGNPRNLGRLPGLSKGDINALWRMYRKRDAPNGGGGGNNGGGNTGGNTGGGNTGGGNTGGGWIQGPIYSSNTSTVGSIQYAPKDTGFNVARSARIKAHLNAGGGTNYELFLIGYRNGKWELFGQGNPGGSSTVDVTAQPGIVYRWVIRNNVGTGRYSINVTVAGSGNTGGNTGGNTRPEPETGGTNGGGFNEGGGSRPTPNPRPKPTPTRAPAVTHVTTSSWSTMMNYSKDRLVIIDVGAPAWCRPCQQLDPHIKAAANRANGRWVLGLVDVDSGGNKSIAQRLGVAYYPTVIAFRNGKVLGKSSSVSARNLNSWINQYLR